MARCATQEPALREVDHRILACHLYDEAGAANPSATPLELAASAE